MIPEPLGGLIILVAIVFALIVGLVVATAGRKSKRTLTVGIAIISAPWFLLILMVILSPPDIDEVNPNIVSDSEVFGVWKIDDYAITLRPDLTFVATIEGLPLEGKWRRMDWNLYLTESNGIERYMRFVQDSGDLLLLPKPPEGDYFDPGPMARRTSEQVTDGNPH
jgi:hypothetical protein